MDGARSAIRPVVDADLPRLHAIAVAGWTPIFARYALTMGEPMWSDLWAGWEDRWFAYTPETWNLEGIVTELDGEVVAFATWGFPSSTLAEVGGNAVDPVCQRRGIGSAQIRSVLQLFRDRGYRFAKVHTGLDPAHGPARAEYRHAGLRLGVTSSVYLNYLDEVARIPVPASLAFRWAEPGDAAAVRQLARDAWAGVYAEARQTLGDGLFTAGFGEAADRRVEEVAGWTGADEPRVRLVAVAGRAVGFCAVRSDADSKLGVIEAVGVEPPWWRQGIGQALCMDAFERFRERGQRYAQMRARVGELSERVRRLSWNVGLCRELPSIDYYTAL